MEKVYKYILDPEKQKQVISIPRTAEFLDAQPQENKIALWYQVDMDELETAEEVFYCLYTGVEIPKDANYYMGTVQVGALVYHIYQKVF